MDLSTPNSPTPLRTNALARVAEIHDAIKRIDNALDSAELTWLRSEPTIGVDRVYREGRELLESLKVSLQGEVALVRMEALL